MGRVGVSGRKHAGARKRDGGILIGVSMYLNRPLTNTRLAKP